jgi:cysteine-S-conjugate beta-lyase
MRHFRPSYPPIPFFSKVAVTGPFDFITQHDRLSWSATKWEKYRDQDVIPLWIADMDFPVAPAIQEAVAAHVAHGNFGYMAAPRELPRLLVEDHLRRYDWQVEPEQIVWLSGLVLGINLAVRACCGPDEKAISLSPIYPPFLSAPGLQGRGLIDVPLQPAEARHLAYEIDFDALEAAMSTAGARLLLLCHPHNPIGRAFTRAELDRLAELCERHDIYVCSDEVHCDLILDGATAHVPFAKAMEQRSPGLARRTITLHGPGKTYNIAGLGVSWAIIPDPDLRRRFRAAMQKLVPDACCFGFTALQAALAEGEPWRQELLARLRANRDLVTAALDRMGLPHTWPEVSYLAWIDARALMQRVGNPAAWFERHGVGLSDGADFGRPGFLRLNFAAPPHLLEQALARMAHALRGLGDPASQGRGTTPVHIESVAHNP